MPITVNTNFINQADQYLLDAKNVKGTYVVVTDYNALATLPSATIVNGSLAYCQASVTISGTVYSEGFYQYDGSSWNKIEYASTDRYHQTGTWDGLTYTATNVGGAPDLSLTIPTGNTATSVCVGNDSRLSDSRTPTAHASANPTYGVGTTANYGHVKLQSGDMNNTSATDGIAAGLGHTHSNYGTYSKPSGGIPDSDLASTFVKSVNNTNPDNTGDVTIDTDDIVVGDGSTSSTYIGSSLSTVVDDLSNRIGAAGTVTSVQVQAGTGLTSSQNTPQSTILNTTIGIDNNYKLQTNDEYKDSSLYWITPTGYAGIGSALSTRWVVSDTAGFTEPYNGMKVMLRVPVAGVGTAGAMLAIDGGSDWNTYHPIAYNLNTVFTTHYPVNTNKIFVYNATQTMTGYWMDPLTTQPSNWATKYTSYYQSSTDNTDPKATWTAVTGSSAPVFDPTKYGKATSKTYTGVWQGESNYDSNTTMTYGTLAYYFRPYVAETLYRYKFVMLDKDNRLVPLTTTNNTETAYADYGSSTTYAKDVVVHRASGGVGRWYKSLQANNKGHAPEVAASASWWEEVNNKTATTLSFRPDKIYWYQTTTNISADAVVGANTLMDIGYSTQYMTYCNFNKGILAYRLVYLCGTYNRTTGLFTLNDGGVAGSDGYYVQVPTNTANITLSDYFINGKDYILLGGSYSSNNYLHLRDDHPMYHFDGTNLIPYDTYNENRIEDSIGIDTWRSIEVNDTELLNTSTSSGAVNFKEGTNVTITGSGNDITISATDTDTGATSVETSGNGNAVTGASYDSNTRKITLTKGTTFLTDHQNIKSLDTTQTTAQSTSSNEAIVGSGTIKLHKISKTGSYNDLNDKPSIPTVNDGTLTLTAGNNTQTFTANQSGNTTFTITAADLGLAAAMQFVGVSSTDPKASGATVTGHNTWAKGEVVIYKRSSESGYEEYINTDGNNTSSSWELLGDADDYALKTITVTGSTGLTGGGNLSANREIKADLVDENAATSSATKATETANRLYAVQLDKDGKLAVTVPWTDTITTDHNQTIKGNGTAFNADDVIDIKGSGIVSVSGNATNKEITISASHQSIKSLDTTATTAQTTSNNEAISGSGTVTLHKISKTGTYSDLISKPALDTTNTTAQTTSSSETLSGTIKLHKVSKTGSYNDLNDTPSIPSAPGTLNTTATISQTTASAEALSGNITLHKISKTGSYNDLNDLPTIPSAPGTLNTTATTAQSTAASEALSGSITLHKVAKTGTYSDLINKPTIDTAVNTSSTNAVQNKAISNYIASRGENLLTNGTSFLQNNYNFSGLTFDASDTYYAGGCFKNVGGRKTTTTDEFMPVDVNQTYEVSYYAKCSSTTSTLYDYLLMYDVDKNAISASHVMWRAGSTTTLAQDLKPNDTKVYLTSIAGFQPEQTPDYRRGLIFWNYVSATGYAYPTETYSRNKYADLWVDSSAFNTGDNSITLKSAWPSSRGTIPAGTPVSQSDDGGTYTYMHSSAMGNTNWNRLVGYMNGVGKNNASGKFREGTAFVKLGWLINQNNESNVTYKLSNLSVCRYIPSIPLTTTANKILSSTSTSGTLVWKNASDLFTDTNTWRNVKVNGTEKLGTGISTGALNFKDTSDSGGVSFTYDGGIKGSVDISGKVDKVASTDNAIARFDGTGGAIQDSTVKIDDNGNIVTAKAIVLQGVSGSISTGESRVYFGTSTSNYYSYLASNTSGAFSLSGPNGGYTFYPGGTYNCVMTSLGSNLGRNESNGGYAWGSFYTKGNVYKHKGGSNGFYTIQWPSSDGTLALTSHVVANPTIPSGTTPTDLSTMKIGDTYYELVGSGGSADTWRGVQVDGTDKLGTGTDTGPLKFVSTSNTGGVTFTYDSGVKASIDLSAYVKSVNNTSPDANGNISLTIPSLSSSDNGSITDGTTTLTFGSNAFNSTTIPTSYVASSSYNSNTKKLTITPNNGSATEVTFGSNAFTSTTIPTSYVVSSGYDTSTKKLTITPNNGSATEVTFGSNAFNSTAIPTTYISSASVSGNTLTINPNSGSAVTFTPSNTATAADDILDGSNTGTEIKYAPYSSKGAGHLYTGTTNPSSANRLNYDGYFYATKLYSNGTEVLTSHLYRPVKVNGVEKLANTVNTALDLVAGNGVILAESSGAVTITAAVPQILRYI